MKDIKAKKIRIIENRKTGSIKEVDAVFNELRLDFQTKEELVKKADMMSYVEWDTIGLMKAKRLNNVSESFIGDFIKSIDYSGYLNAMRPVNAELTRIVWGLEDVELKDIVASDFEELIKITDGLDLLGLKRDIENLQKKKGGLNRKDSQKKSTKK